MTGCFLTMECAEILMLAASDIEILSHVDALFAGERSLAEISSDLIRLIAPADGSGHWPHVLVVLHVLESGRIFPVLTSEDFPVELAMVLEKSLKVAGHALGFRPVGPLAVQTMQLRQRFDSERRKYELVSGRLAAGVEQTEAVRMLGAYLDTGAAPLFVEMFRSSDAELLRAAENRRVEQLGLLSSDAALVEMLWCHEEGVSAEEIKARLETLAEAIGKNPANLLVRALGGQDVEQQLVAAGLVGYLRLYDLVPHLLRLVLADAKITVQAAVIAARLSPEMARQMLSDLLVDMMYGNPEDPDMEITAARERTIVTARCVLPLIGSPLPAVEARDIPSSAVPELVERLWKLWSAM